MIEAMLGAGEFQTQFETSYTTSWDTTGTTNFNTSFGTSKTTSWTTSWTDVDLLTYSRNTSVLTDKFHLTTTVFGTYKYTKLAGGSTIATWFNTGESRFTYYRAYTSRSTSWIYTDYTSTSRSTSRSTTKTTSRSTGRSTNYGTSRTTTHVTERTTSY